MIFYVNSNDRHIFRVFAASERSSVQRESTVDGFSLVQCSNVYNNPSLSLNNKHICAYGKRLGNSCIGDSGKC